MVALVRDPRQFIEAFLEAREELYRDIDTQRESWDRRFFLPRHLVKRHATKWSGRRPTRVLTVTEDDGRVTVTVVGKLFVLIPDGDVDVTATLLAPGSSLRFAARGLAIAGRSAMLSASDHEIHSIAFVHDVGDRRECR